MSEKKSTTVASVSALATALADAQGAHVVITLEDVRSHMDWVHDPNPTPSPISRERTKFIMAAMDFLLSENAPRA